ncbi:MAG: hypothetical protein OEM24_12700 [Paracoccaceae bacterium]|nr:hypothetical protein [Paracoccaceae bacterium]
MPRHSPALILLLAALAAAPAAAQQADAPAPEGEGEGEESPVICQVSGYDVVIVNPGTAPLAAGIGVSWSVRFARMEGVHVLDSDLAPGAIHVLTGALGSSYLSTRTPCVASIAEPEAQDEAADPP